ncbi:putative endonuclease [Polynucleobacter kasalickyi]|uniref:Putative endonuclease n=2 Tax=Polynucleobacter kasalickyi TaxID=1938817 RepID=A0A1W1Y7I8_9BURK|nr:putative endonuclease [Polynucleobacter kasalickyi]
MFMTEPMSIPTPPKTWYLYLLECQDGTFYTGITNALEDRIATHNAGKGAKYTRGRLPVKLLHAMACLTHSEALKAEIQLKKLPKKNKRAYFDIDQN